MKNLYLGLLLCLSACAPNPEVVWTTPLNDGKLLYGQVSPETKIYIQSSDKNTKEKGKSEILTYDGAFIVGVPQDAKELKLTLKTNRWEKEVVFPIPVRKWQEEYVNGLPPKKVSPDPKELERIQSEFAQMRQKRQVSEYPFFPVKWQLPVANYARISSHFGSRRVLNGYLTQGHSGTDYAAPMGTPVVAAAEGRVVFVHPDMFYSGATVLIDHGYGVYTSYAHLSEIDVQEGQCLKRGEPLGKVGMSGRATGPHLHFGLSWYGVRLNPEDLF